MFEIRNAKIREKKNTEKRTKSRKMIEFKRVWEGKRKKNKDDNENKRKEKNDDENYEVKRKGERREKIKKMVNKERNERRKNET